LGNGDGTFKNAVVYDQGIQHELVMTGDFNNDGKLDLALSDQGGISILLGKGDGTFGAAVATGLNASFPIFVLGNFNNDHKLDVAAITGSDITVLPGKGNGKFGDPIISTAPQGAVLLVAGDLNQDGKLDLVTSDFYNGARPSVWCWERVMVHFNRLLPMPRSLPNNWFLAISMATETWMSQFCPRPFLYRCSLGKAMGPSAERGLSSLRARGRE
jgi:FG-GAP-like repeat